MLAFIDLPVVMKHLLIVSCLSDANFADDAHVYHKTCFQSPAYIHLDVDVQVRVDP